MAKQDVSSKGLVAFILFGVAVFAVTLAGSIPASSISLLAGANNSAFSYAEAKGTIWNGELSSTSVAGAPLGQVAFQLSPLSLLRFSPEVSVSTNGAVKGNGVASMSVGGRLSLRDVYAEVDLGAAAMRGLLGAPATGEARINISRLAFSRRLGCIEADGDLWTNALDAPAKRYNLPELPMSGGVSCQDGKLAIALNGENARTTANIKLLVDRSLAYEVTATAEPSEDSIASALRIFGFEGDNGAMTYGTVGMLTGAGS